MKIDCFSDSMDNVYRFGKKYSSNRKVYSERQKYFDIHYKASGKMRTDLQRKLMLRIANPTQ